MVTRGYSAVLYCDCWLCVERRSKGFVTSSSVGYGEYSGETFSECKREAVKDGWKFSRDNVYCYAPGHRMDKP